MLAPIDGAPTRARDRDRGAAWARRGVRRARPPAPAAGLRVSSARSCSRTKTQKTRCRKGSSTRIARSIGFVPTSRSGRGSTGSWRTPRSISCAGGRSAMPTSCPTPSRSPFRDPAESEELRERLQEALTHLTDRQRAVIVLHDVEGFTHGEIGRTLGIPEGTARSDLHHARATPPPATAEHQEYVMTDHRWTPPSEYEVTESLRAIYAAPSDPGYWSALESRILAHVARGAQVEGWWSAFGEMARPALAAAAILVLVAGAAVVHAQRLDAQRRVRERDLRGTTVHRNRRAELVRRRRRCDARLHAIALRDHPCSVPSNKLSPSSSAPARRRRARLLGRPRPPAGRAQLPRRGGRSSTRTSASRPSSVRSWTR